MAQQINLMHAGLLRRSEPFHSGHAALAVVAAVTVVALAAFALQLQTRQLAEQAGAIERDTLALQTRFAAVSSAAPESNFSAELQRLHRLETGQRQMRTAIASGSAGRTQGYSEYFTALARQAQPALWITGFSIAADGVALDLQGRMGDPRLLPGYLRQLNSEPLFKGREFAQLSLKAVEPSATAAGGYTEFALRGVPAAAAAEPAR
jgi:Fimbrial assembly protein (PilN)